MSNSWFQFRQFRVEQDRCGMKVSTDACIQGAWAPVPVKAQRALDIGAGTGLLSLMLAQRFPDLHIDGVELDAGAAEQAAENVAASPWAERVRIWAADARQLPGSERYDFIISNPPFFQNSLLGPDAARNLARHEASLTQAGLLDLLERHLAPEGLACVLLPAGEHERWESLAQGRSWMAGDRLLIRDRAGKPAGRVVSTWGRSVQAAPAAIDLLIRDAAGGYTAAFRELLGAFYLHL